MMINEASSILEGESNEKGMAHLKMISVKLEEKLQLLKTFDESLLSLTGIEEVKEYIMEAEVVNNKILRVAK